MPKLIKILFVFYIFLFSCTPPQGENGLMNVRYLPDGSSSYSSNNLDPNYHQIRWGHMPLKYYVDGDQDLVDRAAKEWNSQLRFTAFVRGTEIDSDVFVSTEQPYYQCTPDVGDEIGGRTYHTNISNKQIAHVFIYAVSTNRLEYVITMHELGHALGLDDEDEFFNGSVMRMKQFDDSSVQWDEPLGSTGLNLSTTWVSDNDKRILRNLYRAR